MTTTLVLGGGSGGQRRHAENLLAGADTVTTVATGPVQSVADGGQPADHHSCGAARREGRSDTRTTMETTDVTRAIIAARGPVLIDCLGTWVSAVIDEVDAWQNPARAHQHLGSLLDELLVAWSSVPFDLVAVSTEAGMGVVPDTPSGRLFRDALGTVNTRVGAASHRVHLVVAGRALDLSGCPLVS